MLGGMYGGVALAGSALEEYLDISNMVSVLACTFQPA